jgi:oligopeptide transport system substrate-binding protein
MDYLTTQWRRNLGIRVDWKTLEWNAFFERLETDTPHIFLNIWVNDYPDPDNFLRENDAVRWGQWRDETYQGLVETARRVPDQQARMEMYQQADRRLIETAVIMPLYYLRSHFLVKPWVKRLPTSAAEWWYWKDVVIEHPAK